MSRGAFYHYFGSKSELLQAVTDRMVTTATAAAAPITVDPDLTAPEKLQGMFRHIQRWKEGRTDLLLGIRSRGRTFLLLLSDDARFALDRLHERIALTGPNDELWQRVNRISNLKFLIIETAFSNKERQLAEMSRHLCPTTLAAELEKLELAPEIYITHLKPG